MIELNTDALQLVWRHFPALFMALTLLVCLAKERRQQERLAKTIGIYTAHNDYVKGEI
jgi:hypothetical protein